LYELYFYEQIDDLYFQNYTQYCLCFYSVLDVLCLGITALQHFVQLNWTGPDVQEVTIKWPGNEQSSEILLSQLALDAEAVCSVVREFQWLALAKAVLVDSQQLFLDYLVKFKTK
jgi:hypothetical protein